MPALGRLQPNVLHGSSAPMQLLQAAQQINKSGHAGSSAVPPVPGCPAAGARDTRLLARPRSARRYVKLCYHRQAITWAWYMLDTWETLLWMAFLILLTYFVLAPCFVNPSSICRSTLAAARNSLAARGAVSLAQPVFCGVVSSAGLMLAEGAACQ